MRCANKMEYSAVKTKDNNKLPPYQLTGFVKRHRVPPLFNPPSAIKKSSMSATRSNCLPGISPSPDRLKDSSTKQTPSNNNNIISTTTNSSNPVQHPSPQVGILQGTKTTYPIAPITDEKRAVSQAMEKKTEMLMMVAQETENVTEIAELKEEAVALLPSTDDKDSRDLDEATESDLLSTDAASPVKTKKTTEEWQTIADDKIQTSINRITKLFSLSAKSPTGTKYTSAFLLRLKSVRQTYFLSKGMPLRILKASRQKVGQELISSGTIQKICDLVSEEFDLNVLLSDAEFAKNRRDAVMLCLSILMNYSDCSDEVTYVMRDHSNFLPSVMRKLQEWSTPHCAKELSKGAELLLKNTLMILHNVSMREDNVNQLRSLHAHSIFLPYLNSHDSGNKLNVYASLADIVTEEEADDLAATPHLARFLLKRLRAALLAKNHRSHGWSVTELVRAVRQLARNDANKRLLVEQGVLPLLAKGVKSSFEDEKTGCMEAIWVLSFDTQNVKEIMKNDQLLDDIISASKDRSHPPVCRRSADGILWQCRQELITSEKYCEVGKAICAKKHTYKKDKHRTTKVPESSTSGDLPSTEETATKAQDDGKEEEEIIGHVMMSYQWADQEVVKRLRDAIREKGYKVWMDIDNMGGSTLQAMAAAIEESFLVLICMSQKYKDSPNCRAEAEYAFQQRKKIVPLIMQKGYRPDGWLGMILGAKLFYDFSGKYTFESRIDGLLKAVGLAAGKGSALNERDKARKTSRKSLKDEPVVLDDSKRVASSLSTSEALTRIDGAKVKTWTADDVKTWLTKVDLNGTQLEKLTGKEIAFLHKLRSEAPEFFYQTLDRKLHITTLSGLISFTDALDDLPTL